MKKYIYVLGGIISLLSTNIIFGQQWNVPEIHPPSSEVFKQSILDDLKSSPTGQFSYQVPIYNLQLQDVSIPVTLDYVSGVKVNDIGGSVGMSWNLNAGGVISRVLRGKPDESYDQYSPNLSKIHSYDPEEWKKFKDSSLENSKYDSEYDWFSFNISNGISGEFFIDRKLNITYNGKDNIKISAKRVNPSIGVFLEFEIIDNLGNRYVFGGAEQFIEESKNKALKQSFRQTEYESAWFLKQIISRSNEVVNLEYEDNDLDYYSSVSNSLIYAIKCSSDPNTVGGLDTGWEMTDIRDVYNLTVKSKRLKKITSSIGSVLFDYNKIREDIINGSGKLLTGVKVSNLNNIVVKDITLNYEQVNRGVDYRMATWYRLNTNTIEKRYFLSSVVDNKLLTNYKFKYSAISSLPSRFSFEQDKDGYPKSAYSNTSPYPTMASLNLENFEAIVNKAGGKQYLASDFEYDNNYVGVGNLIEIENPTKGITRISYEPHYGSEMRKVVISDGNGINLRTKCTDYPRDASKEFIIEIPLNGVNYIEIFGSGSVDYERCLRKDSNGNPIGHSGWDFHDRIAVSVEDMVTNQTIFSVSRDVTKERINQSKATCTQGGQNCPIYVIPGRKYKVIFEALTRLNEVSASFRISYNEKIVDRLFKDVIIAGGSRVSLIENYNEKGEKQESKKIYYNSLSEIESGKGSIIKRWDRQFLSKTQTYPICIAKEGYGSNKMFSLYTTLTPKRDRYRYVLQDNSINNDFMNRGNQVYYSALTEEVENIGYKESFYSINTDERARAEIDLDLPNVPMSSTRQERYLLMSENYYKTITPKNYRKVKETKNQYQTFNSGKKLMSYVIRRNYYASDGDGFELKFDLDPFSVTSYFNSMVYNNITSVTTNEYDEQGNLFMTQTSNFKYKNQNVVSKESILSNGLSKSRVDYSYALDTNNTFLIGKNILGIPLEEKEYKNDILLTRKVLNFSNQVSPKEVMVYGKDDKLEDKSVLTYDKDYKNIMELVNSNGLKQTLLYGYNNSLLIAKIENASKEEVASALGVSVANLSTIDEGKLTQINNLRANANLKEASITTYEHRPLVGVTKLTDPKGVYITYEYDGANRLKAIKDKDGNILNEYEYNYKNN
ncbi:RHS repeat domain-containing protein [Myroides profundi]|uniref:YD repeat-containing protein n=1 Tax=Myroides profundi TaxID=480520 RepID=A0AAJ5BE40_MYRPR|nr:RHS repeat domain-containing protein [Myroides profundi]AJH14555.1 hypothetical protein MPR_1373 [Myroides profundi]SEQ92781.1 YD repeat-containing protein [Myroides profundi]